jgi:catalase
VHAKSHGLRTGELRVLERLPPDLAPGRFAQGRTEPVVMRFSTGLCDLLANKASTPRGLAIKLIEVPSASVALHGLETRYGSYNSNRTFAGCEAR